MGRRQQLHFCTGPHTVKVPEGSGFGSTNQSIRGMDGGISHWTGGEAPASGFMSEDMDK